MKPIKVAQIGTSETTHSAHIMTQLLKMPEYFEVVGVADVDFHSRPLNSIFDNVPKMTVDELLAVEGLEAVVVDCDESKLTEYGIKVAKKGGLAIQFEKPGSENEQAFDELIDIVKEKNTVFNVSYMLRYNPAVEYVMQKIKEGAIGDVYCIEAQMNVYHPNAFRNQYAMHKGGIMHYLGCHMVDIIYRVLGEPEEVIPLNTQIGEKDVTGADFGFAIFKYKNGSSFAKVSAGEVAGLPNRRSLVFSGTKGTLEIRPIESPTPIEKENIDKESCYNKVTVKESYLGGVMENIVEFPSFGRYTKMLKEFYYMVREGKQNKFDYEYERSLHKMLLCACGVKEYKKN